MGISSSRDKDIEEETLHLTEEVFGEEDICNDDNRPKEEKETCSGDNKAPDTSRKEENASSKLQTSWNILNLIQGMGTLGIPYAIKVGGLFCIVIIVLVAMVTNYTGGLIVNAQYEDDNEEEESENGDVEENKDLLKKNKNNDEETKVKKRNGYAAVGKAVWTRHGSRIVSSVQLIHFFGACVLYLILVANFLEGIFPRILLTEYQCMILAGVLVFPTAFLTNLSNIAWLSLTSIASMNLVFISLILYSVRSVSDWRFSTLPVASVRGCAIASCIILFSYLAHPYLPRIEASMKTPRQFKFVANIAFMLATMTKIVFGLTLACRYGDLTKQRITNNIETPGFMYAADACLAVSGLFSYCMPANLIMNIIQRSNFDIFAKLFPLSRLNKVMSWSERGVDLAMRVALVFLSTFVAIFLPEFSLLMAIYGSVTAVCLVIIFPIHFFSTLKRKAMNKQQIVFNYTILATFVAVGAVGFCYSLQALISSLRNAEI
eukprot:gene8748-9684_t